MEQAFNNFNSGKYKEAFKQLKEQHSQLSSTNLNIESYEPNLAICQYLSNGRTPNALQVCIRKLNTLLSKKNKRENQSYDQMTLQIMKYNVGILMLLNGKRENAYLLINDVYKNQKCFIDYLKYRMLLLLMELNINLKRNVEAIKLASKYISNESDSKYNSNQWISLLFHQHSRSSTILLEQSKFMMGLFVSQALMQLSLHQVCEMCIPFEDQVEARLQLLLQRARKRKNNTNKYYQLNLQLIIRFFQAQRYLYQNQKQKSIQKLHFGLIQNQFDKMPQNKIITNIYSAFSQNNIGIVHYSYGKNSIALSYFNKAQTLLSKGCTGVQDKDLQLFSSNYSKDGHKIFYNIGLVLLNISPSQSYQVLTQLKKNSPQSCDFKYWYRIGQAQLQNYHETYSKITRQNRDSLLESALKSFNQSLFCLSKKQIPSLNISKHLSFVKQLKQQEIQSVIMKIKGQVQSFRQNINLIICYICLLLQQYHKVIKHGKQLIENQKTQQKIKIYALQYMMQAYTKLQRHKNALKCINQAEKLGKPYKRVGINVHYYKREQIIKEKMEMDNFMTYQNSVLRIKQSNINEAASIYDKQNQRKNIKPGVAFGILNSYLQSRKKDQK